MKLVGAGSQQARHFMFDASGTITTGGTAQLVLPDAVERSHFAFTNNSAANLFVEFGGARATATLTGGVVTGFTITNSGFGYTKPPLVRIMGGGAPQGIFAAPGSPVGVSTQIGANTGFLGSTIPQPGWPSPPNAARAHATLSGGSVNGFVIDNAGSGYLYAPLVMLINSDLDPNGAATPANGTGIIVVPGGSIYYNGTVCPTTPVSVWGATTGQQFCCKYMT